MIHSRITAKAQTTVPLPVRKALGIMPGDDVVWEVDVDKVIVRRVAIGGSDAFTNNFAGFDEWFDELDSAYDAL